MLELVNVTVGEHAHQFGANFCSAPSALDVQLVQTGAVGGDFADELHELATVSSCGGKASGANQPIRSPCP